MGEKNKEITLESLCGVHLLQGFELTEQNIERYGSSSECDVVKFMLDGVTYIAIEDPDDGYRSYCDEIKVSSEKPKYSIPNCEVSCTMKQDDSRYEHDVLVGTDTHTGLVVFEIGTMYVGDWYPCCHFEYHPENMFCNEQRRVNNSPITLDEAIQHCRDKENCSKCGQEHKQLREWLEELKDLRSQYNLLKPHGRLIDADELIKRLNESGNYVSPAIMAYIETAPTIIEAEQGDG